MWDVGMCLFIIYMGYGHKFSEDLSTVTLYGKCTKSLTFEKLCAAGSTRVLMCC